MKRLFKRKNIIKMRKIHFAEDPVWYTCLGCGYEYSNGSGICPNCGKEN